LTANAVTSRADVQESIDAYLENFSSRRYKIFTVFPGFRDCYMGRLSNSYQYGRIDYANGAIWDYTWNAVMAKNPHVVQIATWNDYGEDAMIEPTVALSGSGDTDRGYAELLKIQNWVKGKNPSFEYNATDLRRPLEVYRAHYSTGTGSSTAAAAATTALFNNNRGGFVTSADALGNPPTATDATSDLRAMTWR
jgi:hypothetical protein